MANEITVTKEGLKKLTDEYDYLKNVRRKEVTEQIRVALGFGDLSENSEYTEAKDEQAKVESRISELEEMLKNVNLIEDDDVQTDAVNVGATVKLRNCKTRKTTVYSIVGSTEADPINNKISDQSPIGKAILGARKGDRVTVTLPRGDEIVLEIMGITK
jgi:transcription elongation factor GreA